LYYILPEAIISVNEEQGKSENIFSAILQQAGSQCGENEHP
jgi:hypothetical protein